MKKKIARALVLALLVVTFLPVTSFAAGKTVKDTIYDDVIKKGNTIYCAGGPVGLFKITVKDGMVINSTPLVLGKKYCGSNENYISQMRLKGTYLYYVDNCYLSRVNLKTGRTQNLAFFTNEKYAVKGKKIYYEESYKPGYKVMNLNGKHKKKFSGKLKVKVKSSNAKGYKVIIDGDDYTDDFIVYLKTPKQTYFIGRI